MLQKRLRKYYQFLIYKKLNVNSLILNKATVLPKLNSVEFSISKLCGNTGKFFKKLAFIGLAMNCVENNKFYLTKLKSIMFSL